MAHFLPAIGQDMLQEPAQKLHDVEVSGAEACTAHFPVGKGDGTVRQAHETAVGDGHLEDIRGKVGEGGVAVMVGLTVDIPGEGPHLWINVRQQSGVVHLFFEEGTVDGGERFDWDEEVGSGGTPGRAVPGEAPARDDVVDVRVVLELPAPGVQDAGESREVGPDEACIGGESLEGGRRGVEQRLVGRALVRAHEGAERLWDGEGEEKMRPWELFVQVVVEPLLGFMLLTLGAVAVATGMRHTMVPSTVLALIEAVAIGAALAVLEGTEDLAVGEGQLRVALQVFWSKGGANLTEGRHDRRLPS